MTRSESSRDRLRVAHLNPNRPSEFALNPGADQRAALADELELLDLPALGFAGRIHATDGDAWRLEGELTARVVQPCAITLEPVTTDLRSGVERIFSPHIPEPQADEVEMPDEGLEPLGQFIDLAAIMAEELVLALPLYPRAGDAALDAPPQDAPEETRKPFAGLADMLKNRPE